MKIYLPLKYENTYQLVRYENISTLLRYENIYTPEIGKYINP